MKKKAPVKSRWALALWLGCIFTVIWFLFSVVITWCTAKTMDRYLEKENGQIASNIINAAQLQRLANDPEIQAETKDYWIWDGVNSDWPNNSFSGGLLRSTNHEPQTAVALYDGEGHLLEKNENAFYIRYITEETGIPRNLTWIMMGLPKPSTIHPGLQRRRLVSFSAPTGSLCDLPEPWKMAI